MMRMKWFLLIAAFLPIAPTLTEVVNSVHKCLGFLLKETPPQIPGILENGIIKDQNRYKLICQTYNNVKRFFTLYDTKNKIPVFSAYKFKKITATERPKPRWMIEPQLLWNGGKNMMRSVNDSYPNQASSRDYVKSNNRDFNRGHLYPVCHAPGRDDKISTFTLTNIVPQAEKFNGGSWKRMEICLKCVMEKFCRNNDSVPEGFVVVGAVPSVNKKLNHMITIPSMLWSAFCCYNPKEKKWYAGAHWGNNTNKYTEKYLPKKTVEELNEELSKKYRSFNVFPKQKMCLKSTVPRNIDRNCQCTPPDR